MGVNQLPVLPLSPTKRAKTVSKWNRHITQISIHFLPVMCVQNKGISILQAAMIYIYITQHFRSAWQNWCKVDGYNVLGVFYVRITDIRSLLVANVYCISIVRTCVWDWVYPYKSNSPVLGISGLWTNGPSEYHTVTMVITISKKLNLSRMHVYLFDWSNLYFQHICTHVLKLFVIKVCIETIYATCIFNYWI